MKRRGIAILLTALTIFSSACGNGNKGNNAGSSATPAPAAADSLAEVRSSGKLRIGTEGTYSPFSFHDENGKLTGFDVEIAREIASRLGVKAEFTEAQWDSLFAGMDAGRFEVIFNEVSVTEERKVKYDFSDPYIRSKAVLIVGKNNNDIKSFADLKGKKSGQSLTSNLSDVARENGAEIIAVDGFNQAIDLLASGRIDATVNENLSYLDLKKQKPDVAIKVVDEIEGGSHSAAVFLKGNSELVQAVNKALAEMKKDGTYLEISNRYFGTDVSK